MTEAVTTTWDPEYLWSPEFWMVTPLSQVPGVAGASLQQSHRHSSRRC